MKRSRRIGALALLASAGLLAAACGGDNDGTGATTTASATTAGATTTAGGAATTAGGATTTAGGAGGQLLKYDESATCGQDGKNESEFAKIEAVDELTVKFTLCNPDVAFPSKVAFSAFNIQSAAYLEKTGGAGDLIDKPIGTGPYKLEKWDRGSQIVLTENENYWGDKPKAKTAVVQWNAEAAQRLVQLQSGQADGIDNVGTDDFDKVRSDPNLQLVERPGLNIFYVGFQVDMAPFNNEKVRQAIGYALDKQRIVDNFYPKGSTVATQFLPSAIPGYDKSFTGYTYDPEKAKQLLGEAGFANGFDVTLSYRDVVRGYLPQPPQVAQDIQNQLAQVGIRVTLDQQESTTFIDNATGGKLPFFLLGWGADYPDATNFLDYHFNNTGFPQFGTPFPDIQQLLTQAAQQPDQPKRDPLYAQVNPLLQQHAPMIPIANGGSATAYKKTVTEPQASPLSNEILAKMGVPGQGTFVFVQNGEPGGLYCGDESDGESLRVCEQTGEALLAYKVNGTEVEPALAEKYESTSDLKEWTFHLRSGVKFSDGTPLTANDVVKTYRVQWDAKDPLHKGRTGDFTYFPGLFGGYLNPPAS
jgi:peptide/nickel transport system substrate-binding protein